MTINASPSTIDHADHPGGAHATQRQHGFRQDRTRMIGRLADSEFDLLDAIENNVRAGHRPRLGPLALTLSSTPDAAARRLYRARVVGLVEMVEVDELFVRGKYVAINEYRLTASARELFAEALELMDRGLVAA